MDINCVIVCVNYADILAHTLPHNKQFFKRFLIVTDTKDEDTVKLCRNYQVEYIQTDIFYEKGNKFDKGAGINLGLNHLGIAKSKDWFLQMDADIWLHPFAMKQLFALKLDESKVYGCDRIMVESFKDWVKFLQNPSIWNDDFWLMELSKFRIGSRLTFYWIGDFWNVLGFFQLWNPYGAEVWYYPSFNDASQSDIIFSQLWKRQDRLFIPEILVVHIEAEASETGKNWQGRATKLFE